MATMAARARRNGEARAELEQLLDRVAARLGVDVPPPARSMKDPDLRPVVEVERFRDMMRLIDGHLDTLATQGEAPAGRETWGMQMLRDFAKQQGIQIPSEANHRKADLVAFLETLEYDEEGNVVKEPEGGEAYEVQRSPQDEESYGAPAPDALPREGGADLPPLSEVVNPAEGGTVTIDEDGVQHSATPANADKLGQ